MQTREQTFAGKPAPPGRWVHRLNQWPMPSPDEHKMRHPCRQFNDCDCRQGLGLLEQKIVRGNHDLLRLESKLHGDLLHRVDRGAVHIGLAGFPQSSIAHRNPESFEQALQRCRSAIRGGGLDNFGNQPAAVEFHGCSACWIVATSFEPLKPLPPTRSTSDAGEMRSTCTCTVPGRPCFRVKRLAEWGFPPSSKRSRPSRNPLPT